MLTILCGFITLLVICVNGQRAAISPHLVGAEDYFVEIMHDMLSELEDFGWWNLKLLDISQTLNEHMYSWHVKGKVNYTNGFVVSIEKIDLTDIKDFMLSSMVNNTIEWDASVWGIINLRNAKVGFDVIVNLDDEAEQRYTGTFTYASIQIMCIFDKNMNSNVYTVTAETENLEEGGVKMIYLPANHVTEVLSRGFEASSNWDSVTAWCQNTIQPILSKLAHKKIILACVSVARLEIAYSFSD